MRRRMIEKILFKISRKTLEKYKPKVIAVTGSVGKTSAKQAIFTVLNYKFDCRTSYENFNNEIGVPLTILGEETGGNNLFKWIGIILRGKWQTWFTNNSYPEVLILELGIDRPGDMDYLVALTRPDIAVVTPIGVSHLEFFENEAALIAEKRKLIKDLPEDGHAILNSDNDNSRQSAEHTKAQVTTYGFRSGSDVHATDLSFSFDRMSDDGEEVAISRAGFPVGLHFKVQYQGKNIPFYLHRVLGRQHVSAALPAIACGAIMGMNLLDISEALKTYVPARGRTNLVAGLKGSLIIDDSYNASSPESTLEALRLLRDMDVSGKKIAVIGDMLEMGSATEQGHREVGRVAAEVVDELVTFGPRAKFIADEAMKHGLSQDKISMVDEDHRMVERILQNGLEKGDVILVKGSQGMRLEKVVKMVMAHPMKAKALLVRQSDTWLNT